MDEESKRRRGQGDINTLTVDMHLSRNQPPGLGRFVAWSATARLHTPRGINQRRPSKSAVTLGGLLFMWVFLVTVGRTFKDG